MKQIRILHIVGSMNRGGAETFLMNVLRNIDRQKFKFVFLCYGDNKFDYEDEVISLGGKIVRTSDVKGVGIFKHIKNIARIIKKERIDIVHAHTYYNSAFSLIAAKKTGVKVRITHSHNTKSEDNPTFLKKLYFCISKLLINSLSTHYFACGQEAGKVLFWQKNKFFIINNGIILNDFRFDSRARKKMRKELSINNDTLVIGHVGRFDEQKNHKFLIDIFDSFQRLNPNSILLLIGDGVLRKDIETSVLKLGIGDKVRFLGKRSDVNALYNVMDLFLFPSLFEGLPVTLIEAQANGLMCLISDTIDRETMLTKCVNFYPLSCDAKHWTDKIRQLDLGRINTRKAMEHSLYNMTMNINNIEDIYERLLFEGNSV